MGCKCNFKKGRCEHHHNACRVHCSTCIPAASRKKRVRPRKEPLQPAGIVHVSDHLREKRRRTAAPTAPLVEVEEHVGLVYSDHEHVESVWDGNKSSMVRFLDREYLRNSLPSHDVRPKDLDSDTLQKFARGCNTFQQTVFGRLNKRCCNLILEEAARQLLKADLLKTMEPVLKLYVRAQKGSIERRVLMATLASVYTRREIAKLGLQIGVKLAVPTQAVVDRGRSDWNTISQGVKLAKTVIRRKRFDEELVKQAIKFLLSEQFVGVLSWGTKKVKLGNETVVFPSLVRKKMRSVMFSEYRDWYRRTVGPNGNHLPKCTVYEILGLVTNGQKRALTAVNFMLGSLIYDNFLVIDRIIELYTRPSDQKVLKLHATLVSNFLKNQYPKHVVLEDNENKVCTHGIKYALDKPSNGPNKSSMECNGCRFVPYFFDELREKVGLANITYQSLGETLGKEHAFCAIKHAEHLVGLWRGQCVRVANQRQAIASLHHRIEQETFETKRELPEELVIVMDYKMKYVPKYYRQKSIEHFGKRGTSWHGFLVIFYVYNNITKKVDREHVYCDQIMRGTNLQDGHAVAALVEVFLEQLLLSEIFSKVKQVSIQTDNANYYHSNNLILALPYIGLSVGVIVRRYIHTETCDGKGLIDAHFAMGMRHVDRHIGEGNNAASPGEVFDALASAKGIPNSFAQLVELDRDMLLERQEKMQSILDGMSMVSRQNEIVFESIPSSEAVEFEKRDPYSWAGTIQMKVWEFSNVSVPVVYILDPNQGTVVKVNSDDSDDESVPEDSVVNHDDDGDNLSEESSCEGESSATPVTSFCGTVVRYTELGELRHEKRQRDAARHEAQTERLNQRGSRGALLTCVTSQGREEEEEAEGATALLELAGGDLSSAGENGSSESEDDIEDTILVEEAQRVDLVAFAVRYSKDVINDPGGDLQIRDGTIEQPEYALAATYDPTNKITNRGYGRRSRHGTKVGATNAAPFRTAIAEIFQNEGNDKQHASWVREKLQDLDGCQFRLDIPCESDVKKELDRCIRWKAEALANGTVPDYVAKMEQVIDPLEEQYSQFIYNSLETDRDMMPREFLQVALDHFRDSDFDMADDEAIQKRVMSIYSSRRSKLRSGDNQNGPRRGGSGISGITGRYKEFVIQKMLQFNMKPTECWDSLCEQFIENGSKPADFPAERAVLTFTRNWRNRNKGKIAAAAEATD